MAPLSLDCLLLCGEDNSDVFDEPDCRGGGAAWQQQQQPRSPRGCRRRDRPDDEEGLPVLSDEFVGELVEKERRHLPKCDYLKRLRNGDLDVGARTEAIDWMFKLLAVACLSLAAKVDETEVPLSLDLQVAESRFVFEARTIQRMELLVMSTLCWRMQAVSPFSFLDHFLWRISGNETPARALILRSVQVILSTLRGIELLEFRPSEVAAAVAIRVAAEAQLAQTEEAISALTQDITKERVMKCMELIHESAFTGESANNGTSSSVTLVPQSPIGVLEAACFSYSSSQNNTLESNKRRKIDTSSSQV